MIDLISRQAAKDAYCKHFCHPGPFCPDGICKEVNKAFDSIPSVDPCADCTAYEHGFTDAEAKFRTEQNAAKPGRWIKILEADDAGNATYQCSVCGSGEIHVPIVEVPYCWQCGARMESE